MSKIITSVLLCLSITVFAQVPDRIETDCSGLERSIHDVGDSGSVLIVASKGLDCGICISGAPAVGEFATANADQIEVWGAMSVLYSSDPPACTAVDGWVNSYQWGEVFAFRDLDEFWAGAGFPTYYVIEPVNHEMIYEGSSWNAATSAALGVVLSANDLESQLGDVSIYSAEGELRIALSGAPQGNYSMEIFNLVGQKVATFNAVISENGEDVRLPFDSNRGIYILRMSSGGKEASFKFLLAE